MSHIEQEQDIPEYQEAQYESQLYTWETGNLPRQQMWLANPRLCLKLLFNLLERLCRTDVHPHRIGVVVRIFLRMLAQPKLLVSAIKQSASLKQTEVLNRVIGLPSLINNALKGKCNYKHHLHQLLDELFDSASTLDAELQYHALKKVMIIGEQSWVAAKMTNSQEFRQILIKHISKLPNCHQLLLQVLRKHHKTIEVLCECRDIGKWVAKLIMGDFFSCSDWKVLDEKVLHRVEQTNFGGFQIIVEQLLNWWESGHDSYLTASMAKLRCNLLCSLIARLPLQYLQRPEVTQALTLGIHQRLTSSLIHQGCLHLWQLMAQRLNLQSYCVITPVTFYSDQEPTIHQGLQNTTHHQQEKFYQPTNDQNLQKVSNGKKFQNQVENLRTIQSLKTPSDPHPDEMIIQPPRNITDCILALRNPLRRQIAVQSMGSLIRSHSDDLPIHFNQLVYELLSPLDPDYYEALILLMSMRPEAFIEQVSNHLPSKVCSQGDRIFLMGVLEEGIQQLSHTAAPPIVDQEPEFYFKKVKSTYYKTKEIPIAKEPSSIRRWGHTRIAHQAKAPKLLLHSEPYVNRLYSVVNLLYFRIIHPLGVHLEDLLRKNQILAVKLFRLLGTVGLNLANHIEKHSVLKEILVLCARAVQHLRTMQQQKIVEQSNKSKQTPQVPSAPYKLPQNETGATILSVVQCINQCCQQLDSSAATTLMEILKDIIAGLKELKYHAIPPLVNHIEATIYQKVFAHPGFSEVF